MDFICKKSTLSLNLDFNEFKWYTYFFYMRSRLFQLRNSPNPKNSIALIRKWNSISLHPWQQAETVTSETECSACKSFARHSKSSTQTMDELIILLEQKALCIFSHHTRLGSIVIRLCKHTLWCGKVKWRIQGHREEPDLQTWNILETLQGKIFSQRSWPKHHNNKFQLSFNLSA